MTIGLEGRCAEDRTMLSEKENQCAFMWGIPHAAHAKPTDPLSRPALVQLAVWEEFEGAGPAYHARGAGPAARGTSSGEEHPATLCLQRLRGVARPGLAEVPGGRTDRTTAFCTFGQVPCGLTWGANHPGAPWAQVFRSWRPPQTPPATCVSLVDLCKQGPAFKPCHHSRIGPYVLPTPMRVVITVALVRLYLACQR